MNNAFERLQTASHKLAEVLYSQTAAAGGEAGDGGAGFVGIGRCRWRRRLARHRTTMSSTPSTSMSKTKRRNKHQGSERTRGE